MAEVIGASGARTAGLPAVPTCRPDVHANMMPDPEYGVVLSPLRVTSIR